MRPPTVLRPPGALRALHLRLHAYPVVTIDGVDAPLRLKRGLALLALLAELGRKVSRTQAAGLLWPDAHESLGRSRLRRLVHEVHAQCGADPISADADALWIDAARWALSSDVQRVRAAAQDFLGAPAGEMADPSALLAPDAAALLDGFDLESDAYAQWLAQRRAEHGRLLSRALQRLADRHVAQGDAAIAVEAAERLIALDAAAEAGYAALIAAHGRGGDLAAVESAYFRCADLLRAEFGVAPSPAVEAAYAAALAQVQQGAVPAPAAAPPARIQFAQTNDGAVAYSCHGDAGPTLVVVPGLLSHIEIALEEPRIRRCMERLAARHRVVLVDRRGTGLSERVNVAPTIASAVEDIAAVVDALGGQRVWLFGASVGGAIAIAAAARMPGRLAGLVLYGAGARGSRAPDYPWAMTGEQLERWLGLLRAGWGEATSLEAFAPDAANDSQVRAWWARMLRSAASQNGVAAILRAFHETDVRDLLPGLRLPTLVIQREDDRIVRAGAGRYIASRVPGATLALMPGQDHWWWHGDADAVMEAIERFIAASIP
jgi:pimeloyl-ACP methyl ester carboxylesterase/DNA-binding SARP family transcriptional activator